MAQPGKVVGGVCPPPVTEVGVDTSRQQERDTGCGEQFAGVPHESPNLLRNDSEADGSEGAAASLTGEHVSFCRTLSEPCGAGVRLDPLWIGSQASAESPPSHDDTPVLPEMPLRRDRHWSGGTIPGSSRHGGDLKGKSLDSDVLKRMLEIDDKRSVLGSRRMPSTLGNFEEIDDKDTRGGCQMADKVATSWRDAGVFSQSFTKRRRSNTQSGGGLQRQDRFMLPSGTRSFDVGDGTPAWPISIVNHSSESNDSASQSPNLPHDIFFSTDYSRPNSVDSKAVGSEASSPSSSHDAFAVGQTPDKKKHWGSDDETFKKAMVSCCTAIDMDKIQTGLALI